MGKESYYYYPFGETRVGTGNEDYKYTGKEEDEETGLYYYGARYYDPKLGRFISADTMVPDFLEPQSLNRYSYTRNNPLKYIDPTGHNEISPFKDNQKSATELLFKMRMDEYCKGEGISKSTIIGNDFGYVPTSCIADGRDPSVGFPSIWDNPAKWFTFVGVGTTPSPGLDPYGKATTSSGEIGEIVLDEFKKTPGRVLRDAVQGWKDFWNWPKEHPEEVMLLLAGEQIIPATYRTLPAGGRTLKITEGGLQQIERYLTETPGIRYGEKELKMIERLRGGERTPWERRFYDHESIESVKHKEISQMYPNDPVKAALEAHRATCKTQNMDPDMTVDELIHPEVQRYFDNWP